MCRLQPSPHLENPFGLFFSFVPSTEFLKLDALIVDFKFLLKKICVKRRFSPPGLQPVQTVQIICLLQNLICVYFFFRKEIKIF
jgi:hypothetical protein